MIRIISINRKVDVDKGFEVSDVACQTLLVAGNDVNYNKARFRLTAEEATEFDALTRRVEARIAESVVSQEYSSPEEPA